MGKDGVGACVIVIRTNSSGTTCHMEQLDTAHQKISIIGCRADWRTPELAEVDVDLDLLARFARMCFQRPEGGHSPLRTMLSVIGGDSVWQSRFSKLLSPLCNWCRKGDRDRCIFSGARIYECS